MGGSVLLSISPGFFTLFCLGFEIVFPLPSIFVKTQGSTTIDRASAQTLSVGPSS